VIPGSRLGPYEIVAALGAGGMGEVYRARDTRLSRHVAIKVISPRLLADAAARDRFEREARTMSAVSHPHICTLYDVGDQDGLQYLVLEYLEGETLTDRIARQPTPVPSAEALRIAAEIAEALTTAHRAGIVHRDLKPSNIMLTRTGVKVLDFGLAKLLAAAERAEIDAAVTHTATEPVAATSFAGTLPYMAPEQLEGRPVDARSDIFAFGAIVYEMLTGRRAFVGDSRASVMSAILSVDPEPLTSLQPLTPTGVDRIVRKCLAKDPDARWQSATDLADELRWLLTGSGSSSSLRVPSPGRRVRPRLVLTASSVLAIAGLATWWLVSQGGAGAPAAVTHQQITFSGDVSSTAISPDGRSIAYASGEQRKAVRVLVRDIAGGQALELWKGASVLNLAWTADGAHVIVAGDARSSGLWLIPRLGGSPRLISAPGAHVTTSPDGSEIAVSWLNEAGFRVVPVGGGPIRAVKLSGYTWTMALAWVRPNLVLVLSAGDDNTTILWRVAPDGTELSQVYSEALPFRTLCVSPLSNVAYTLRERSGVAELISIPFTGGAATTLLSGLPIPSTDSNTLQCSVSADGRRIAYTRGATYANLWQIDVSRPRSSPTLITRGTSVFSFPAVSADGQWIAATEGTESNARILRLPRSGGEPFYLGPGRGAVWSPDGKRLAFASSRGGSQRAWIADADGQNAIELKDAVLSNPLLWWLPDGRLAFQTPDARNFRIRDLSTGREEMLLKDSSLGYSFSPSLSKRGDRVAMLWNRKPSGLWVISWPAREERFLAARISPIGWSADDQWIYGYAAPDSTIVRVSAAEGKVEPVTSFSTGTIGEFCTLTSDARTVICPLEERNTDAWVIENFDPAVRAAGR
jgi:serine/threonine-protein kinase